MNFNISGVSNELQLGKLGGKIIHTEGHFELKTVADVLATLRVSAPLVNQDAATKEYAESVKSKLDFKQSVRVASTTNIDLSTGGLLTIDGITLVDGDRVLVKDQTLSEQNGIYVASVGAWFRSDDADNAPGAEVTAGMFTFVEEGTANADTGWILGTADDIILGTTELNFVQFSAAGQVVAGLGITKTDTTIDIGTANIGRIVVNADNIDLATTSVVGGSYGSGTQTSTLTVDQYGRLTVASNASISIPSSQITDFNEAAQDAIGAMVSAETGSGVDLVYDDGTGTLTANLDFTNLTSTTVNANSKIAVSVPSANNVTGYVLIDELKDFILPDVELYRILQNNSSVTVVDDNLTSGVVNMSIDGVNKFIFSNAGLAVTNNVTLNTLDLSAAGQIKMPLATEDYVLFSGAGGVVTSSDELRFFTTGDGLRTETLPISTGAEIYANEFIIESGSTDAPNTGTKTLSISGSQIKALDVNSDLILIPGTTSGVVVVGESGVSTSATIESAANLDLNVTANGTGLLSLSGATVLIDAGTSLAAEYFGDAATLVGNILLDNDIPNKLYVDNVIAANISDSLSISIASIVDLNTASGTIGVIPANRTVVRVSIEVIDAADSNTTITIDGGNILASGDVDLNELGEFSLDLMFDYELETTINYAITNPSVGSANVIIEYATMASVFIEVPSGAGWMGGSATLSNITSDKPTDYIQGI